MRYIQQFILTSFLGVALSLVPLALLPSWAGSVEDKALREAAGCAHPEGYNVEGVKAALKAGADPNAREIPSATAGSLTPLSCVGLPLFGRSPNKDLNHKAVDIAKLLFAAGAKLESNERRHLFFISIVKGNLELVRLLIDKGASPTAKLDGYTPAEVAKKHEQLDVYEYLISQGATPVDNIGAAQMVLSQAAGDRDIPTMQRAIKDGARINGTDHDGDTALIESLRWGIAVPSWVSSIWWLLDNGADPNQEGNSGYPLHVFIRMSAITLAAKSDRSDVLKPLTEETLARLLKAGAKVSGKDKHGRTPLHVAAETDNVLAAELLIAHGAKVMPRDDAGKTPLDYAESGPMIALLKANGATEH